MDLIAAMLSWMCFGLVAGAIARLFVPGRQPLGCFGTMALGVVGSFAGGFLNHLLRGGDVLQASGMVMSILGAILVLVVTLSLTHPHEV
jgi:uncharacterized membrane protein YeaQ/YmgE (transglycosylase-associated protein family)